MRNRPYGFDIYLVNVKTIRRMAQIFVAFSEKLNFNHFWLGSRSLDATLEGLYSQCVSQACCTHPHHWIEPKLKKISKELFLPPTSIFSILTRIVK